MIKEVSIKNFRSIREGVLDLGRFTVLTGANNSGKSSVLYALQVLKNVVTNPNRSVDDLLNLNFLNLGGIEEVLFSKVKSHDDLSISIQSQKQSQLQVSVKSKFTWRHDSFLGSFLDILGILPYEFAGSMPVSFPYALNKTRKIVVKNSPISEFNWNGITLIDTGESGLQFSNVVELRLNEEVVQCIDELNNLDVIPTHRGFTKSTFNIIPLQSSIFSEDEVATLLATDKKLQSKVSFYFEKITGKRFHVSISPGVGFFFLQVREHDTPFTTELVNQGMGVNQIIFLLAKILYDKNRLICIDEPEIHLHPTLIEQFVRILVEIAQKENKQFIFSTHSEHWLMSFLAEVYERHLDANDLKVYYLQKEGAETLIEQQKVQENGQIEGGLKNFLAAEMSLANRFFPAETTI